MSDTRIYNPCETISVFRADGAEYRIPPNEATIIKSQTKGLTDAQVAQYAVDRLGKWGVCIVSGPVKRTGGKTGSASNKADQILVDEAEAKYAKAMTEWAEGVVLEAHKENEPRVAAGLPPLPPTDSLKRAKKHLGIK
jgi:hypothetical protein